MTRLIDADLYKEDMTNVFPEYYEEVLDAQPTIDAVPVIRCKDCKYYEVVELNYNGTPDKRCKPSVCTNGQYAVERPEGWYCGDAERKESEA